MKKFGAMLDMSRNAVMKPEEIVKFAKILKSFGYNMIQLYTEDTYEIKNQPYFGYKRGRYTTGELKYIVDNCETIGIEVIPCIQTLAHLNQIFRWKNYWNIHDIDDILLVEEDETYSFIEDMLKTLKQSFKSPYVHIGMDEALTLGKGAYLDKHGLKNRFEILSHHLKKVVELCKKYDLKPIMWSDMFFRVSNNGEYYSEDPQIYQDAINSTPDNVGLVYWDYYHKDKAIYDKMINAHKKLKNEIWFAGGAWTWTGFAPSNGHSLETMKPAMQSLKDANIDNVLITMWGDNGKECSFYAVLPSLYAIKRFYDGETDLNKIAKEFNNITGESFEDMMMLDLPNMIQGNKNNQNNPSKYMLYNDPINGIYDSLVKEGVTEEYKKYANTLRECGLKSKNYGYLFECLSSLCNTLSIKYDLGLRLRNAYTEKDNAKLKEIADDFEKVIDKLNIFYDNFSNLWYKENKPEGFEVQDIRLGGLMQRLKATKNRLINYINGSCENLPELETELLDAEGRGKVTDEKDLFCINCWCKNVTTNVL